MLSIILSSVSVILVVTTALVLHHQNTRIKTDTRDRMQGLVDQINDAQYYEYKFDKKQDQNIKNIDKNVTNVHQNIVKLQNNVKFLEKNAVSNEMLKKQLQTDVANVNDVKTKKLTVANGTTRNNIVLEGGRTLDGNNDGWAAINFNGYYNNGEKRIDPTKSRFRILSEQRGANDALGIDQFDKNNNLHQYVWMSDGTVGLNNNKMRFSNSWTGFPDNAPDRSEISNDAKGFKKLMIVGNKSSGEGIRKVGVWDRLDVHGNQGVDGTLSAQNTQGRDHVFAGNWASWMRNNGDIHAGNNMNVQNKLFFKDSSFSTAANAQNNTDPYYMEKIVAGGDNSHLRLTINNDPGESFQIWGDSCRAGNCAGPGVEKHRFDASGNVWHKGDMTFDGGNNWIFHTPDDGRRSLHIAPSSAYNNQNWNWNNQVRIEGTDGRLVTNRIQLGNKFLLSGVGDAHGNDGWLRLFNTSGNDYYGGLAAGELWTRRGSLAGSDIRMKKDVANLSKEEVDKLTTLDPKRYVYKDDAKNRLQFGLIAQDVEKIYPNMVETGPNGMKSLRYNDLIPVLIAKVKDMENKACVDGVCLTKEDIMKLKSM
jgi:hypothetical protein